MDAKLKQRVIGAVVLTTLAIIVLPMLLDGSSEDRARVVASIPEPPAIELKNLSVGEVRREMARMEEDSAARLPAPVPSPAEDLDRPDDTGNGDGLSLDESKLPVSWTLQVGSFRDREKAVSLRKSLRDIEYRSYIIKAVTPEGETYRVFVGPMLQKERLQTISEEIESRFQLKGLIVRYRIEEDAGQLGG